MAGLGEQGEQGGWDAPTGRGDHPWWWSPGFEWRAKLGAWIFAVLASAAVLAGLAWGAWWLFVGEYQ